MATRAPSVGPAPVRMAVECPDLTLRTALRRALRGDGLAAMNDGEGEHADAGMRPRDPRPALLGSRPGLGVLAITPSG